MGLIKNTGALQSKQGAYLNPSKLEADKPFRFNFLTDEPLEYFEVWGINAEGSTKPFRFVEEPTEGDIKAEFGDDWDRKQNYNKDGLDPVKFGMAAPVYCYDDDQVKIFAITHISIIKEIDSISQQEDYKDNFCGIDLTLTRTKGPNGTKYKILPLPRKKGADEAIAAAWNETQAKGFDLTRLIGGGDPFKLAA
jgi:hypothetical protein